MGQVKRKEKKNASRSKVNMFEGGERRERRAE